MDCPICLEDVASNSPVCTPCGHIFCTFCLKAYIKAWKNTRIEQHCPTCRQKLPSTEGTLRPVYLSSKSTAISHGKTVVKAKAEAEHEVEATLKLLLLQQQSIKELRSLVNELSYEAERLQLQKNKERRRDSQENDELKQRLSVAELALEDVSADLLKARSALEHWRQKFVLAVKEKKAANACVLKTSIYLEQAQSDNEYLKKIKDGMYDQREDLKAKNEILKKENERLRERKIKFHDQPCNKCRGDDRGNSGKNLTYDAKGDLRQDSLLGVEDPKDKRIRKILRKFTERELPL
ncbi:hypothetical protein BDQ12DRAFT_724213 [Crucibulum laeve]|uniref:RING-type domain-containing protein n=1 Tax=Crucibulum laeve TaxID=68775 RepID=A0A5C3LX20_9AGAR|nr:hypothetical protein BDQ12DRAFT_724213 [Crucibulum laeve]